MLAKGKGYIGLGEFRKKFNLPDDTEIMDIVITNGGIEFHLVSADEVEKKFHKDVRGELRRFRLIEEKSQTFGQWVDSLQLYVGEETLVEKKAFGFDEAMKALLDGKKVARSAWNKHWEIRDISEFGNVIVEVLSEDYVTIAIPSNKDLMAFDWKIVE